jgi:anti-anti-sigma factor
MTGSIGYAINDGIAYLRLSGAMRHDTAGGLEALIEQWFAADRASVSAVVIDLNQVGFLDSTAIGLLASIARELQARSLPKATVFSTQADINQLLRSLCLDQALDLVERATDGRSSSANASALPADAQCSGAAILKAHETLIYLNEGNRVAFQPVVELLRGELGKPQSEHTA